MEDRCIRCRAVECATAYVLVEHSPTTVERRARATIVSRVLETYPLPMCRACSATVTTARRRQKRVAAVALGGLGVACLYFIAAIAGAPTTVAVGLLFGGGTVFAGGVLAMVLLQKALVRWLPLADNRGTNILFFTAERGELEVELEKHRLASAEIRGVLPPAPALPSAKLVKH